MWVGLSGPFPQQVLADYARYRVKERLQTVPGVGEITMGGYLERNVRIWLDAATPRREGADRHRRDRRAPARARRAAGRPHRDRGTRGQRPRARRGAGPGDAAADRGRARSPARPSTSRTSRWSRTGSRTCAGSPASTAQPAQGLGIRKQRGANAVAVARSVHASSTRSARRCRQGWSVGINFDSTRFIEESVHEIQFELLLAVLLTALVCWLFLGSLSSTLNVVLAIPMSLLGTVAVIYFLGFTLNTFTLLGLALAVGIVVDDAIMVHGEHLPARRDGEGPRRAPRARERPRSPSPRSPRPWRSSRSSSRSSS